MLAAFHGSPSARPEGGSRGTVDALARCFAGHGGELRLAAPAEAIEVAAGRATAVRAGGERIEARRAVISSIDARRVFSELVAAEHVPPAVAREVAGIHVGRRNVSELKVDAVIARLPELPGPAGFERALMLSPNTDADIEAAFARIALGELPERPPLMIGFPSTREAGWARDPDHHVIWLSTFVPWALADGEWDEAAARVRVRLHLERGRARTRRADRAGRAPDHRTARLAAPDREPERVPEPRRDVARPAARHAALARARPLRDADRGPLPDRGRDPPRRRGDRDAGPQRGRHRALRPRPPPLAADRSPAQPGRDAPRRRPGRPLTEERRVTPVTAAEPLELLTGYQGAAIVAAAVETGVAGAIADGERPAGDVAAELGTHPRATAYLLGAMVALGLAERTAAGFRLSGAGACLSPDAADSIAEIVRKEWFFYRAWSGLPESVRDGGARIAPWRERLASDPETSLAFLRALDDLADRFGGELPGLAGLERGGRLLDAGGGAGSHSAKLAAAVAGLEPTVLDLEPVEAVLRERHPELPFVAGDLDLPRFGRPEGERWDYVLLANVLHDHPPERCPGLVAEAAALLEPGGTLLIYEWVLGEDGVSPPAVATFAVMMLVENDGGGTWTEAELAGWARDAGLEPEPARRGGGPIAVMRARSAGGDQAETNGGGG